MNSCLQPLNKFLFLVSEISKSSFFFAQDILIYHHYSYKLCLLLYRAEFTKEIVTPAIGVSGVGGAMAVYGALDAVVSLKE